MTPIHFDAGGTLPVGLNKVRNATGAPEPLMTRKGTTERILAARYALREASPMTAAQWKASRRSALHRTLDRHTLTAALASAFFGTVLGAAFTTGFLAGRLTARSAP